jgi:hypothetical protein
MSKSMHRRPTKCSSPKVMLPPCRSLVALSAERCDHARSNLCHPFSNQHMGLGPRVPLHRSNLRCTSDGQRPQFNEGAWTAVS